MFYCVLQVVPRALLCIASFASIVLFLVQWIAMAPSQPCDSHHVVSPFSLSALHAPMSHKSSWKALDLMWWWEWLGFTWDVARSKPIAFRVPAVFLSFSFVPFQSFGFDRWCQPDDWTTRWEAYPWRPHTTATWRDGAWWHVRHTSTVCASPIDEDVARDRPRPLGPSRGKRAWEPCQGMRETGRGGAAGLVHEQLRRSACFPIQG